MVLRCCAQPVGIVCACQILDLLTNAELIAVNQDPLGKSVRSLGGNFTTRCTDGVRGWAGPLSGGAQVVFILNRGASDCYAATVHLQALLCEEVFLTVMMRVAPLHARFTLLSGARLPCRSSPLLPRC